MKDSISILVFSNVKQFKSGVYECLKKSKIDYSSTCALDIVAELVKVARTLHGSPSDSGTSVTLALLFGLCAFQLF